MRGFEVHIEFEFEAFDFELNPPLFSSLLFSHVMLRCSLLQIMFNSQRCTCRALLYLNPLKTDPLSPLSFSLKLKFFTTTTSESESAASDSFTVSYLVDTVGLPRETALKASKRLRFKTSEKPDSVFAFFRNRGFSDSDIRDIVIKEPRLLLCDPHKSISPKLDFFLSKGSSASDIARMLTASPRILQVSLKRSIIPLYELLMRFLKSDEDTIAYIIRYSAPLCYSRTMSNLKMMIDFGVCDSSIFRMLVTRPSLPSSSNMLEALEEVKGLGFDSSTTTFGVALLAKRALSKSCWDEKVDAFKKWGWSDETVVKAFRSQPNVMLVSSNKINQLMSFWVNQLGWDSLALAKDPRVFALSIQKRIAPRASVVQFLLKKGLRKKNASLTYPIMMTENLFLSKFVLCFKEESAYLQKLYEEKLNPS